VRQFLDRVPETAVSEELDYLQMLTEDKRPSRKASKKRGL
jgi:phospholipid/cholesterol/gamma-HCH transport system ATP-binding protein